MFFYENPFVFIINHPCLEFYLHRQYFVNYNPQVWDRRCLAGEKSAGILTGHLDGVTFIDSRGDGRYFISNCKDQRIKLWDIRKMSSVVKV